MSLNLAQKKAVVAEVADIAKNSNALVAVNYLGLTVDQVTRLRESAREKGVQVRVVKNTLTKRAFEGTVYESLTDKLVGPMMLAFSQEEPNGAARVFRDFIKEESNVEEDIVEFLWFADEVYTGADLKKIASMPTKDEAIALLMACMKEPVNKLARTIAAVKEAKEAAQFLN